MKNIISRAVATSRDLYELVVSRLISLLSRILVDSGTRPKNFFYIMTSIGSVMPLAQRLHGIATDACRCVCCGGILLFSLRGREAAASCGRKKENACEHYVPKDNTCDLPGRSCRGTPSSKYTRSIVDQHRRWVAFKAFAAMDVASRRGHCKVFDPDDAGIIAQIVKIAGFHAIWWKNEDGEWSIIVSRPGVGVFPKGHHSIRRVRDDKRWHGDPLVTAFTRVASRHRSWSWLRFRGLPGSVAMYFDG